MGRNKINFGLFFFIFLLCFQVGCAAQKSYKAGVEWEQQEEYFRAGKKFLFSLKRKPNHRDYHAALKRVAKPAYEQGLLLATTAQENADFPKALEYYTELKAFTKGLRKHDLLTFEIIDIEAYINDMSNAAAKERYEKGVKELTDAKYESAIKSFRSALNFNKEYSEAKNKIGESYYLWGEQELTEKKYRSASERFTLSNNSQKEGYKDANKRAADILFSIGKFYLRTERCQAAWKEFKKADELAPSTKIRVEISNAKNCAIRDLVIVTYTNTKKDKNTSLVNQKVLTELLAQKSGSFARANEYVNLHTIALRSRSQGLTDHPQLVEYDRLLFVDVDGVDVKWSPWSRTKKNAQAKMWVRCTETNGLCQKDVQVDYAESARTMTMTPTGNISMKTTSDRSVWNYKIEQGVEREIRYAEKFMVDGVAVTIGTQKRLGTVVLSGPLSTLSKNPKTVQANTVANEMFLDIANSVAEVIVERAGSEAEPPKIQRILVESSQ